MIPGIQEIKALAIKYSKKQLANMAQTGLIDPQKAVMAGMMRDRIAKEDMQPPTTTVAQDTLGLSPQPQMAQMPPAPQGPQMPPQMGMQPSPQMAQAQPQMGAPAGQPPVMAASGGMTSLPVEIADYAGGGIVAFGDGGDVPGYAGDNGSMVYDPMTGALILGGVTTDEPGLDERLGMLFDPNYKPYRPKPTAPQNVSTTTTTQAPIETYRDITRPQAQSRREAGSGTSTGPRVSTGPTTTRSSLLDQPSLPTDKPYIERPTLPDAPTLGRFDPNAVKIPGEDLPIYTARERRDIGKARRAAELEEGADPEMYAKMIKGVEEKKGKLEKRAGEVGGEALMQFGLGLIGARKGEEAQTVRKSATEALNSYRQDRKDLRAADEKYDERIEALRMSDQQAKLTGARADVAQAEQDRQLAFNADVERRKARNDLAKSSALIGAQLYGTEAQHKMGVYQTGARAATDVFQAEQQANSKYFSDMLNAKINLYQAAQQARTAEENQRIQLQIANINAETQRWIHSRPPAEIQAIQIHAQKTGKPWEEAARDYYQMRGGSRTTYTREEAMKDARTDLANQGIVNPTEAQMQEAINRNMRVYGGGGGGGGRGSLQQGADGSFTYQPPK